MEAKEILDTMLGYLGFVAEIHEVETESGHQLQIFTAESEALIGPEGETLEDLQFLLNRILQVSPVTVLKKPLKIEQLNQTVKILGHHGSNRGTEPQGSKLLVGL